MDDPLSLIPERYPALNRVLVSYMQRLRTLPDEVMRASWLCGAAVKAAAGNFIENYLEEWDKVAELLDAQSSQALSRRFLRTFPEKVSQWRPNYDDAFLEVCSEMLGYGWLKGEKKCSAVKFIHEGPSPQPDLLGDETVVVECKHFRTSQKDRYYFAHHQGEVWTVDGQSPERLLNKVLKTVENSVLPKFASYPPNRFERYLFADFSFDAELRKFPGTISSLVEEVRKYLANHAVKLVAIKDHTLGELLTTNEIRTSVESSP